MPTFNDIDDFINYTKNRVEQCIKSVLPKLKEKAEDILIEKIYMAYEPSVYYRMGQLLQAFEIKCKWEGNECIGILYVKDIKHNPTPYWIGDSYSLEEIITGYFARDHVYTNGKIRKGVDVLGLTNQEVDAMRILLNELKKYFDIV